jgi:hypothetical protein
LKKYLLTNNFIWIILATKFKSYLFIDNLAGGEKGETQGLGDCPGKPRFEDKSFTAKWVFRVLALFTEFRPVPAES